MAEGNKPPKLPPKASKTASSSPAQATKNVRPPPKKIGTPSKSAVGDGKPKKLAPKQTPAQNGSGAPASAQKLRSASSVKKTPSQPPLPAKKQAPKLNSNQQTPSKPRTTSLPNAKRPSGTPKRPSAPKLTPLDPKPELTPTQSASSVPVSSLSKSATESRKPSLQPRSASVQKATGRQRPELNQTRTTSNVQVPKTGDSDGKPASRKPSLAPRKPSVQKAQSLTKTDGQAAESKPAQPKAPSRKPSLGPRKPSIQKAQSSSRPSIQATESSASIPKAPSRKPSLGPRKPSTKLGPSKSQKPAPPTVPEHDDETPAHRLAEEDRNLKDILSESQCGDLTILIANITESMRKSIENAFDAASGFKLLNKKSKDKGDIGDLDFDPGTVDVGAYDKERKEMAEQEKELGKPQSQQLKKDALAWFDEWRQGMIQRVGEVVNSKETAEEQKDEAAADGTKAPVPPTQPRTQKISSTGQGGEYNPPKLEDLFPRVKTPLTKLPIAQRILVLHSIFLLLLSLEHYNAASRVLLLYLTSSLKIGLNSLREDEERTAQGLLEAAKQMTAEQEADKKKAESQESRKWKIRLASAAGAAIIGYTGGMAAPMVAAGVGSMMGELGLGATTAASYLGTVAGNTAIVGSLFGAYGGRMTGQIMSNISAEVEDFAFLPVHGERKEHDESLDAATDKRRLRVIVAVSGWLLEKEEVVSPWRVLKPSAEVFALRFELEALMNLGQSFDTMLSSAAYSYAQSAVAKRTAFSELMSAMWPVALVKVARVVDNPFSLAKARAEKAGEVLAEALMNRAQGERPVTLIGYSLGARVIWSCLMTLAKKRGFGFVESAVMIGSPIPSDASTWRSMRATVSGRLVNVYSENDYLLAFLYRSASLQYGVAGLMPITGLSGVENVDVSEMVSGHLRYRYLVGSILDKIRFEDVDKEEVQKEAKAFEALIEEEKKNTYDKQLKDNAGNLYEQYGERLGLPKQGRKLLPQKEKEVNDEHANNEASKMEKEIDQKTQKGLMQWAVEQLYISRPDAPSAEDAEKVAANPEEAAKKTTKDAKKQSDAATKSLYQRASDAMYLTRSGGPEGEAAARDKLSQVEATSPSKRSYFSSAAGYLPSLRSSPKSQKRPAEVPKRPSTLSKSKSKSRGSVNTLKRTKSSKDNDTVKPPEIDQQKLKEGLDTANDAVKKGQELAEGAKSASKSAKDAKENVESYSNYLPSFGRGSSEDPKKKQDNAEEKKESPEKSTGGSSKEQGDTSDVKGPDEKQDEEENEKEKDQSGGYGSYIPSFGFGGSAAPDAENVDEKAGKTAEDATKADAESDKEEKPKDPAEPAEKPSGYGSYVPSFGFGGSSGSTEKAKEDQGSPEKADKKEGEDNKGENASGDDDKAEKQPAESSEGTKEEPKPDPKPEETPKKKYPWETVLEEEKKAEAEPAEQSSSYTSYLPSFGLGGSSSQKQDTPSKEDGDQSSKADTSKASEGSQKVSDTVSSSVEGSENQPENKETPKKKYPWEIAMSGSEG